MFIFSNSKAEWIKLFSINEGDLFIDSKSIIRKKNKIFYNQMVNYREKKSNGILSLKTFSELDCKNLKIRDLNYELFNKRMGKGENLYNGNPSKKWKKYKEGTSANFLNKILCDRVHER
tara:strand:- start:165 stop:521 length:357 start_codon:yes stop_codon:yes gene_type:complete